MKKVIIIGGGISGLTAGVYAQKAGFDSVIYEKHTVAGGQCTGWRRNGCFIDGCLDWLTGSAPGSDLYDIWKETGALSDNVKVLQMPHFGVFEYDDVKITLWQDIARLEKELTDISPEDAPLIRQLVIDCKTVQNVQMPSLMPIDMLPLKELMALGKTMTKFSGVMKRMGKFTCREYASQYKHPALRKMFENCMPEGYSFSSFVFSLGTFCSGSGGLPEGGSLAFVMRMVDRYKELGGKLVTGKSAQKVIINNKQASKVMLDDGTEVKGDYFICACDVKYTFDKLLDSKYHDVEFEKRFNNPGVYSLPTSIMASYHVKADLSAYPHKFYFETEPFSVGTLKTAYLGIKHFCYEPSFAPAGESVVTVTVCQSDNDYAAWEELSKDSEKYKYEKQRIAEAIQKRIETKFPELSGKIKCIDLATPITYNRYTNAYHGAWMSFMMTPESKTLMHKGLVKGIDNLLLSGMWLQPPGGTPVAASTGKFAVQRICKKEKCQLSFNLIPKIKAGKSVSNRPFPCFC